MAGYPEGALMHSNKVAQDNMETTDQFGLGTLMLKPAHRPRDLLLFAVHLTFSPQRKSTPLAGGSSVQE